MLNLDDWKLVFATVGLIGVLLLASPTLGIIIHLPSAERFSELWLLGPGQMAEDYPSNVTANVNYSVYVGVGNHMGSSAYYVIYVKFGNRTDALPNATEATPSPLPPLYEYRTFLRDDENWTVPLNFSLSEVSFVRNSSVVEALTINNVTFAVNSPSLRDVESKNYYYRLFVELWIYDLSSDVVEYNNRWVSLVLNLKH
jgi:hypothetical protein